MVADCPLYRYFLERVNYFLVTHAVAKVAIKVPGKKLLITAETILITCADGRCIQVPVLFSHLANRIAFLV